MSDERTEKKKEYKGIRKLRSSSEKEPRYTCENCKCNRYAPCRCMRKGDN